MEIYNSIRKICRNVSLDVMGGFAKPSNGIHIISGHFAHRTKPDIKYMENIMMHLSKIVQFVRIEEAISMIDRHEQPDSPLVAFTFDDGFDDCYYYIAPVLERYNINAIFFVNPNFVDGDEIYIKKFTTIPMHNPGKRPMRWNQLKELQERGFIIGAHTMDHYLTSSEDRNELEYQIVDCKKVIEDHLGGVCENFAWPYGRFKETSDYAIDLACKNYKHVFSQTDYTHYFSYGGRVINRRHFEPFWPINHVKYFISKNKSY